MLGKKVTFSTQPTNPGMVDPHEMLESLDIALSSPSILSPKGREAAEWLRSQIERQLERGSDTFTLYLEEDVWDLIRYRKNMGSDLDYATAMAESAEPAYRVLGEDFVGEGIRKWAEDKVGRYKDWLEGSEAGKTYSRVVEEGTPEELEETFGDLGSAVDYIRRDYTLRGRVD